jgi:hypothetical protein
MDRTVDAIAGKLTPQQLMFEAMGVFKDGSSALATKVVQTAREHPIPATIIGIGIGLLFTEKSRSEKDAESIRNRNLGFGGYGAYPGGEPSVRTGGYVAGGSAMGSSPQPAGFTAGYTRNEEGGGRVEGFTSAVKDKTTDIKDSVALGAMEAREKVGGAAAQVKETAAEAAARVRDQAAHVKDQVASQAGHLKEQVSAGTEHVRESADHLRAQMAQSAGRVREQASQVPVYARQQWHDAQLGFWQTMDQKPFAIGLAVLAAGVAAGLTVPATRKEQELMGETRDRLLDQAREMGREAVDKGKQVARVASDVVKTEVERAGLKPGAIADKVRNISREAEQALKDEAGKVMPETLKATGTSMPMGSGQGGTSTGGAAGRGMSAGFASTADAWDADSTMPGSGSMSGSGTSGKMGTSGSTGTTSATGSTGGAGTGSTGTTNKKNTGR